MDTQVTIFTPESVALVRFNDKKGNVHEITPHGAIFKGGAALAQLKDIATTEAFIRAKNGRYRAAADILCAAFPSIGRAADKLIGTVWANKSTMATLVNACHRAEPGKNGWTKNQILARLLLEALRELPALAATEVPETIENTAA